MTVERSKRRCFLTLTFLVKSISRYSYILYMCNHVVLEKKNAILFITLINYTTCTKSFVSTNIQSHVNVY